MLLGSQSYSIDSKARVPIPSGMLVDSNGKRIEYFVATKGFDRCVALRSAREWEGLETRLRRLTLSTASARAFLRALLMDAVKLVPDATGRINVPAALLHHASIGKEVMLLGAINQIELWNPTLFEENQGRNLQALDQVAAKIFGSDPDVSGNDVERDMQALIAEAAKLSTAQRVEAKRRLRVFLCYAGPDRSKVESLRIKLVERGFDPWMDKVSILPGQDWELEIQKAIESADFFIACISHHFEERTYGNKELRRALSVLETMPEGSIYLIPARLEECSVPSRVTAQQWVDLFDPKGFDQLIRSLLLKVK